MSRYEYWRKYIVENKCQFQMLYEYLTKHRISEIYSSMLDARNIEARNSGELTFPGRFLGPADRIFRLARRKLRNRDLLVREITWYYCQVP